VKVKREMAKRAKAIPIRTGEEVNLKNKSGSFTNCDPQKYTGNQNDERDN
jgi:hypothetical protein